MTLEKQIAEDYGMVLKEAQSMGCNKINALYNIPLDNMKAIVNVLEEVQNYRAIGTPEECRFAVEKQKPHKWERGIENDVRCPFCGTMTTKTYEHRYCSSCGQRLE